MKVFLRKVVLMLSNSLRSLYIGINSNQPRRDDAMNDSTEPLGLAQASIRIAVAASFALLLGVGAFGIDDAWGEARTITIETTEAKVIKVNLGLNNATVIFKINGCYCATSAQKIKEWVVGGFGEYTESFGPYSIAPGQTITRTYYCYSKKQVVDFEFGKKVGDVDMGDN